MEVSFGFWKQLGGAEIPGMDVQVEVSVGVGFGI